MSNAAIVLADSSSPSGFALAMTTSPIEARRRYEELQAFVQAAMVDGVDFGVIPGTGNKPTLYQPGAQKLAELYAFSVEFHDVSAVEDFDKPLFHYRKKCVLRRRGSGELIAEGVGSCNSREDKYAYRWVPAKKLPPGTETKGLKSRSGQWGPMYRLPNDDVCSVVNTVEKMACKRALVAAVICATRSSGLFTQDVEDLPRDAFGEAESARSWSRGEPTAQAPAPAAVGPQAPADDFPPSWQEPAAREPSPAPPPVKAAAKHTTRTAAPKAAPAPAAPAAPAAPPPPTPQLDDEAARLRAHLEQACLGLPDKFEYRGTERTRADFRKSALEKCGTDVGLLRSVVNTVWGLRGDANAELDRLGAKLGPAWGSTVEKLKKGPMAHAMLKLGEALAIATYERRIVKALEEDGDVEALLGEASADMRLSTWGLDQVGQMARPKSVGVDPERAAIVAEDEVNEKTWPKVERPVWDGIVGGSRHES